jgi:hypothetical protein
MGPAESECRSRICSVSRLVGNISTPRHPTSPLALKPSASNWRTRVCRYSSVRAIPIAQCRSDDRNGRATGPVPPWVRTNPPLLATLVAAITSVNRTYGHRMSRRTCCFRPVPPPDRHSARLPHLLHAQWCSRAVDTVVFVVTRPTRTTAWAGTRGRPSSPTRRPRAPHRAREWMKWELRQMPSQPDVGGQLVSVA